MTWRGEAAEDCLSLPSVQPESETGAVSSRQEKSARWMQALILAMLYSFPVFVCARNATVADPDIWWHMRTGEWILRHGFPHTDPFSVYGADKAWAAYSWLFDLIVFKLHEWLGLAGLVAYTAAMVAAITISLHRMIRRLYPDFTGGLLLTLTACVCMEHTWTPRSWQFSILFFVVEMSLLMQARRTGRQRALWLLPLLFALWANLHIVFLYGLVVLGIPLAEAVLARWWKIGEPRFDTQHMGAVFLASAAATLVNPYGWGVYATALKVESGQSVLSKISEMMAMPFRDIGDYCVLLLTFAAVAVLARARQRNLFELGILAFGVLISFHSQRDIWVLVIAAAAIVADGMVSEDKPRSLVLPLAVPAAMLATVVVAPLLFLGLQVNNQRLEAKLAEKMPARGVNFIKEKRLTGPLFNDFNWGGYLMWTLRMPVSIDSRSSSVWGGRITDRSLATWNGLPGWNCNPDLRKARLVIGPVEAPLTQLLRMSSGYELAYHDDVAAVFIARPSLSSVAVDAQAGFPCTNSR